MGLHVDTTFSTVSDSNPVPKVLKLSAIQEDENATPSKVSRFYCMLSFLDDPLFVGCDEDCLNRLLMIEW